MEQVTHRGTRIGVLQLGIIGLTAFTAGVHLYLSSRPDEVLRFWFFLNGLGYLALVAALYLPQLRQIHGAVRLMLIAYATLTICLWILLADHRELDPLDITTKTVEVVLVILLFIERHTQQRVGVYR